MEKYINQQVIVRAEGAGVFFGILAEKDGNEVLLRKARRIYYWDGASECIELAQAGCKQGSKITREAGEVIVENVLEIHPCTDKAIESINSVPVWRYR